ncbi:MAG: hypothetical protein IPG95_13670 [Saprospiraceae bacterium]|nr:hypothetical protein [Saprospiraceae bacterium]
MINQLSQLCSRLLTLNRITLLLLIASPISIELYTATSVEYIRTYPVLASLGVFFLLAWIVAIGHKANEKLESQGIASPLFKYFNFSIISVVLSYLLVLIFTTDKITSSNGFQIHRLTPWYFPVLFVLSYLIAVLITSKTLVSAELKREAKFSDYYSTLFLFLISAIGLWFIQPRVQSL